MVIYSEDVVLQILKKIREHGALNAMFTYRMVKYDGTVATEQEVLDMAVKMLKLIKEGRTEAPLEAMILSVTTTTTYKDGRWSVEIDRPKEGDKPRFIDEDYKG